MKVFGVRAFMQDNRDLIEGARQARLHFNLDTGCHFPGLLSNFEHTIHELCHAQSLGINLDDYPGHFDQDSLEGVIADRIVRMGWDKRGWSGSRAGDLRKRTEELKSLAIEWNVWQLIGFPGTKKHMRKIAEFNDILLGEVLQMANLRWAKTKAERIVATLRRNSARIDG